jgi:hypothetical protein
MGERRATTFRVLLLLSASAVVVAAGVSSYLHFHSVSEAVKYSVAATVGGMFVYFRLNRIGRYHGAVSRSRRTGHPSPDHPHKPR